MAGDSPSVLLKRAADKLAELAEAAPQAPWRLAYDGDLLGYGPVPIAYTGYGAGEVRWAAGVTDWVKVMSPVVAAPLADILRGVAFTLNCHPEYAELERNYITLAKLVLGAAAEEAA